MNVPIVILIGAVLGALDGMGIFFEPREPYKWQIFCAATLKGVLTALLTGFSISATTRWWLAIAIGSLYGLAFAAVIYLAKGGPKSRDVPYVVSEWDYHRRINGAFHSHWGNQISMKTAYMRSTSHWQLNSVVRLP